MSTVEILTIGDELIEGRLIDSNAAWLSEQLVGMGFEVGRHTTVGDTLSVLSDALREAAARGAAVIVTGGLGPTTDDLTADAAALAFDAPLEERADARDHIETFFAARGRSISPNNYKQALLPRGSSLLPNPNGTAVGFRLVTEASRIYFMPGVPREMAPMFEDWVAPDLQAALDSHPARIFSLKLYGAGESNVGQSLTGLDALVPPGGRLVVQYRASFPEIHVRLLLHGLEGEAGDALLQTLGEEARGRLARYVYATGGGKLETTFPEVVLGEARALGLTLCTAESCTGGLVGALLTSVPGSSDVYVGGVVAYHNSVKQALLDVPEATLAAHGAVSEAVAAAMATGARARLGADYALAITGVAGPGGGTAEKPVGTVWIGIASPGGVSCRLLNIPLDRERVRQLAAHAGMALLRKAMAAGPGAKTP